MLYTVQKCESHRDGGSDDYEMKLTLVRGAACMHLAL